MGIGEWTTKQYDDNAQPELVRVLRTTFAQRTRDEWVTLLTAFDSCVAPVLSIDEVVTNPQIVARGAITEAVEPSRGTFEQLGPIWAGSWRPEQPVVLAEEGSSVAGQVLRDLNYTQDRIDDLVAREVVE
jgi:alpha-methylacyl-CoA racemase